MTDHPADVASLLADLGLEDFPYHEFQRAASRGAIAKRWPLLASADRALARLRAHRYEIDDSLLDEELSVDDLQRAIGIEPEILDDRIIGRRSDEVPALVSATERLVGAPRTDS